MNDATSALLAIVSGIITLAIVSVLVSKRAQTPAVLVIVSVMIITNDNRIITDTRLQF